MAIAILFMRAGTVSFIQVCRYLISHQVEKRGEEVDVGDFGGDEGVGGDAGDCEDGGDGGDNGDGGG